MTLSYQYFQVLKKVGFILFIFMVFSLGWEQVTTQKIFIELNRADTQGSSIAIWFWGILSLLNGFLTPVFLILMTVYALDQRFSQMNLFHYLKRYFSQTLIETLRAWGKVLFGFLFFIFPGVWLHIKYTFVPFVVLESQEYDLGQKDALQYSSTLVSKKIKIIVILLATFNVFIPLVMTQFFDAYRTLWKTPIPSLALSLIDTLFYIWFTLLFYRVYLLTKRETL